MAAVPMGMPMAGPGQDYWKPVAYGLTTEQSARDAVQELVVKNADIIKIWVDDRNGTVKKLTPALYRAVIDEAHKNNKQVIAHLFTLADAKDLVKSGIGLSLVRDSVALREARAHGLVIANAVNVTTELSFLCLNSRRQESAISHAFQLIQDLWQQ